jgi:hypothetical protein
MSGQLLAFSDERLAVSEKRSAVSNQPNPEALGALLERILDKLADGTIPMEGSPLPAPDSASETRVSEVADPHPALPQIAFGDLGEESPTPDPSPISSNLERGEMVEGV